MKMKKQYMAFYTDGHDCGKFTFYSEHRANSRANDDDAFKEARKRYGANRALQIWITDVMRWMDGE